MVKQGKIISLLQREISKQYSGILFSVVITNISELSILIDDLENILNKFYNLVEKTCEKNTEYKIFSSDKPSRLYIIIPENKKIAEKLAYKIYSKVQLYVDRAFPQCYIKCAIGSIKFCKDDNLLVFDMLSRLNYGMKNMPPSDFYYCHEETPIDVESLRIENTRLNLLRSSLVQKKAKFVYQAVIDRKSGEVEYHECLLRYLNEKNEYVTVGPIIKSAESKGLINIVDFTVVDMVIDELDSEKNIILSVNISNAGVLNLRLLKHIEYKLKKHNVANRLIIEITETSINSDFNKTRDFIETLKKYGCKFAIDDFGSGFTSFKQLLSLPIDIIKIDGMYISDILENNHSRFFVEALIRLAEDLGIKTVAEFVENGEIAKFLVDIKIGGMQGNFFLPASDSRVK